MQDYLRDNNYVPPVLNLEYLPTKILLKLFSKVDDVDLLRLASISYRFDKIAQDFFKMKYINNYFKIDLRWEDHEETWRDLLHHFNWNIAAIDIKKILLAENDIQLIKDKLKFRLRKCIFRGFSLDVINQLLCQQLNVTHISILFGLIAEIPDLMDCIDRHLITLRYLKIDSGHFSQPTMHPVIIEQLEYLGLPIHKDSGQMLRQFNSNRNIKKLKLEYNGNDDLTDEIIAAICSFTCIETLSLSLYSYDQEGIEMIASRMPNLVQLIIKIDIPDNDTLLPLIRECENIEKVIIKIWDHSEYFHYSAGINKDFHDEFLNIIETRTKNLTLELRDKRKSAIINKDGIFWNNMWIHRACYNHNVSQSVHLIDLAAVDGDQRRQPFDKILEHLDVKDLHAIFKTSRCCEELVRNYMNRVYKEGEKLTVFNLYLNEDLIRDFGQYLTNIEVIIDRQEEEYLRLWKLINEYCWQSVTKLTYYEVISRGVMFGFDGGEMTPFAFENNQFYFPNLRIFLFCSHHGVKFDISKLYPCQCLTTMKFRSSVWIMNNVPRFDGFNVLTTIKFRKRNQSVESFLHNLNSSIEREILFYDKNDGGKFINED